jgi:hypothetical protein
MVWGFPLFMRGLAWFYSGNQLLETLVLVLSCPLMVWQPMAKGFCFSFYLLNNLLIQVIPKRLGYPH